MLNLGQFVVAAVYLTQSVLCVAPLKLDFEIHRGNSLDSVSKDNTPFFSKRESEHGVVELTLENDIASYVTTIKVGSNQQEVSMLVSVINYDTWFIAKDVLCLVAEESFLRKRETGTGLQSSARDCLKAEEYSRSSLNIKRMEKDQIDPPTGTFAGNIATSNTCTNHGSFDTSSSTSFKEQDYSFTVKMDVLSVISSVTYGIWGNDSLSIGNASINHVVFGVANKTDVNFGRLGLGFPDARDYENLIPSLPLMMKNQGVIDRVVYSLYINSLDASSGSVLFGAVDHAKYTGELVTFPMMPPRYSTDKYQVIALPLSSIHMRFDTGSEALLTDNAYEVFFDPTTTLTTFPSALFDRLLEILGGAQVYTIGLVQVKCPSSDSSVMFDFNFGGVNVSVPLTSLLITENSGRYSNYYDLCTLAITHEAGGTEIVFGDNILRHGYFVFDLEGKSISIAQAKYTDDEDIEIISDIIPGAVPGSSISIYISTSPSESVASGVDYSTGSFSGPDYASTAEVITDTHTPLLRLSTSATTATSSSRRRLLNGGPSCVSHSLMNSISAAVFVLLSYISLV